MLGKNEASDLDDEFDGAKVGLGSRLRYAGDHRHEWKYGYCACGEQQCIGMENFVKRKRCRNKAVFVVYIPPQNGCNAIYIDLCPYCADKEVQRLQKRGIIG